MTKEIQLTKGKVALVDDEDYEWLNQWKWYCSTFGYAVRETKVNGKKVRFRMHRVIMSPPSDLMIDHINGNPIDNRRANLRICTNAENARNRRPRPNSVYPGVSWHKGGHKWEARIKIYYKEIYLGLFSSFEDAKKARDDAAKKYFGEFAPTAK